MWKKSWMMKLLITLTLSTICVYAEEKRSKLEKRSFGPPFRRSPVDRIFIRFGRATRSADFGDFDPVDDLLNRDARGKEKSGDSFVRFGKAADNFVRFGRGGNKQDNFVRFGRGNNNNADSFVRFGKAAANNFMRFGRGKDNFVRLDRNKDNFLRFGRSKDNFMRFGRNKDNFLRFGKGDGSFVQFIKKDNSDPLIDLNGKQLCQILGMSGETCNEETILEKKGIIKGSFARFGKSPKNEDGFIRFGRKNDLMIESDKDNPKDDIDLRGDASRNTLPWDRKFSSRPTRDSEEIGQPPVIQDSQETSDEFSQTSDNNTFIRENAVLKE